MLWHRHQKSFLFSKSEKEKFAVYIMVKSAWDLVRGLVYRKKSLCVAGWYGITAVKRVYPLEDSYLCGEYNHETNYRKQRSCKRT